MSFPVVTFTEPELVDIYAHLDGSPHRLFVESCFVEKAPKRMDVLARELGRRWTLLVYHKLTPSKHVGSVQKRSYK